MRPHLSFLELCGSLSLDLAFKASSGPGKGSFICFDVPVLFKLWTYTGEV